MRPLLDICICTCRRPELLRRALESLSQVELPDTVRVSVTVVDNDPEESAQPVIRSLQGSYPLPIHYAAESRRGIPFARNRCLDEAQAKGADYLVFIDDDEWVAADWLQKLYSFARDAGGRAVVCGSVISLLPASSPDYYNMFFSRKRRRTGERLPYCATNNVLIPLGEVRELGLRFDESRPFAGGEDVMFFTAASQRGMAIFHCAEAVVYEDIPEDRANLRWLSRRKYSVGITQAHQKLITGRSRVDVLASALLQLLTASLVCALSMTVRRQRERAWLRVCRSAGMAGGVFGAESQFYRRAHS
ncbi:Glycosyl transferase family 2 [Microbulbifer aggregans]|uniref:Glycosyl transferase family 2 n=1 Tax=Microbulbifer aggregans TaxID=1769779 RepID=A0A1C9W466_9GAMM|nr:glycosyltransferase family 2 protein [Microbulbifer aggregans]AOS95914.1 Glycosyl transferase family 2 [Microbulbifer aggregans]